MKVVGGELTQHPPRFTVDSTPQIEEICILRALRLHYVNCVVCFSALHYFISSDRKLLG